MDSNRLMHFKAIAESENISKAADSLFISQPALSKSLSLLEDELGCSLFNRVGRRLHLNDNGKTLLHYANGVDEIFKEITQHFKQKSSRTLSICGVGNFYPFLLKDYFKDGMRPIKLNITRDVLIPKILFSGEADVAVADDYYLKDDEKTGLRRIPVLFEQLLLSVPKTHPLAGRKAVKINELENETILRLTTSNEMNNWLDKIIELNKVRLNWSMTLDMDAWRYYMLHESEEMPPFFERSSSFLTARDMLKSRNNRSLLKVEGAYANRMIFIWYFENNKDFLDEFLQCVKNMYK